MEAGEGEVRALQTPLKLSITWNLWRHLPARTPHREARKNFKGSLFNYMAWSEVYVE